MGVSCPINGSFRVKSTTLQRSTFQNLLKFCIQVRYDTQNFLIKFEGLKLYDFKNIYQLQKIFCPINSLLGYILPCVT